MSRYLTTKIVFKSLLCWGALILALGTAKAEDAIVKFNNIEAASGYVLTLIPSDDGASKKKESLLAYIIRAQSFREEFLMSFEERALPPSDSNLMTPGGSYVSVVAVHYPGCFALYPMDVAPFMDIITNPDPAAPVLEGICALLSVIHSAVEQLKVVKKEDVTINDGDVSTKLLRDLKLSTTNPQAWGTPISDIPKLYKALTGKEVKCERNSFRSDDIKAKCSELRRLLDEGYDCNLDIFSNRLGVGHLVNVSSAAPMSEDSCQIVVVDTGKQGDGKGQGVPVEPGYQYWSIKSKNNGISIYNFKGDDKRLWNAFDFDESDYRCCKIVTP